MKFNPYPYQTFGINHILEKKFNGSFIDMGLGKTVMALTAIEELIYDRAEVRKVLVTAPLLVAKEVWTTERDKWNHLGRLRISKMLGTEQQRIAGLKAKADIYVINVENVAWLIAYLKGYWPFDMLVMDESSKYKSHDSQRFKMLKTVRPKMNRVVALTGTPASNSLLDLWPQVYMLDQGERLGKNIGQYREIYFNKHSEGMHSVYEIKKEKNALIGEDYYEKKIFEKISDICISMSGDDYLKLPKRTDQIVYITMPDKVMKQYLDFERDQVMALVNEKEITAINAAVLTGKLLQFANGAIYDANHVAHELHNLKLEALAEDVEAAQGEPFLVFYQYQHDKERILQHLKHFKPVVLNSKTITEVLPKWKRKEIPLMIAHPKSAAHGVEGLQIGGHLTGFFGCSWSQEDYTQAVKRIDRQGQTYPVLNRRYVIRGTMDEDVIASLDKKEAGEKALLNAVKARVKFHLSGSV